jgi:thiamine kinase-like enzyme
MTRIAGEIGEIDPAWLTLALRRRTGGAAVAHIELLASHSGTTGRARFALDWGLGARADLPRSLFVKLQPFDEAQRGFLAAWGIGVAEARFYSALGDGLPVRAPRVWFSDFDDDGNFVIGLEDLVASGCRFPSPRHPDVLERARSTVEELARLHAAFWESDRFAGDLAWVKRRPGNPDRSHGGGGFIEHARTRFGEEMGATFRRLADVFVACTPEILDLWDRGQTTLIHGDAHMGNLFVDGERTGFLDWAMVGRAPGMRDVAYFLCNSIPAEVRRAHEQALLARYREVLAEHGIALDPELAFEQYRLFAVASWLAATSTAAMGSLWQAERIGRGGMQRATAAIEDLDSVGLLEARLAG